MDGRKADCSVYIAHARQEPTTIYVLLPFAVGSAAWRGVLRPAEICRLVHRSVSSCDNAQARSLMASSTLRIVRYCGE